MANELVKPGCESEMKTPAENVGPQFCGNDIKEAFRDFAIDPMAYQSQIQYFKISNGLLTSKNRYVKFSINATAAAADRTVRIGAVAQTGEYLLYNRSAGAADFADISDQYGTNVKKVQGFSKLVTGQPMIITQWRMISSDSNQLAVSVTYNTINPDLTITPQEIDLAATKNKSDQATDLIVAYGIWVLSRNHYLEFTALTGQRVDVILEISAIQNIDGYVQM